MLWCRGVVVIILHIFIQQSLDPGFAQLVTLIHYQKQFPIPYLKLYLDKKKQSEHLPLKI